MPSELHTRLRESVADVIALSDDLEAVIALRSRIPGSHHGRISHSQPPWCAPVADAVLDLHAEVRQLEHLVLRSLGLPQRHRGGSSANTARALTALNSLLAAADDDLIVMVLRKLDSWARQASIVLGRTEPPRRIPRVPGQPELACPGCSHRTLRSFPLEGVIRCIDTSCLRNGKRPEARMTWSPVVGDFILVWEDGVAV
jgi:hypothetical protein